MSRIALVVPFLGCGGTENSLFRLGRELKSRGHDVELVVTEYQGEWFERASEEGLRATFIAGRESAHPLRHAHRVGAYLGLQKFDVVLLNNAERFAQAALNMLPDSVCVVPVVRSDNPHAYDVACSNHQSWNVLVAVSPKTRTEVQARLARKPVLFIPNGVEAPPAGQFRDRTGHARPLRVLYVGRLEHKPKGVLRLPAIVRAALDRGLRLDLVCVGDGRDAAALHSEIRKQGVADHMTLIGARPHAEVYRLLLDAHVLLAPSFFEGLPGAPLEAQACGCVPIASRLDGVTDAVIREGETGFLVEGGDAAGFAAALAQLHDDPACWQRMSLAGAQHVLRNFSVKAMGDAYEQLLRDAQAGVYALSRPRLRWCPVQLQAFRWWELVPASIRPSRRARQARAAALK